MKSDILEMLKDLDIPKAELNLLQEEGIVDDFKKLNPSKTSEDDLALVVNLSLLFLAATYGNSFAASIPSRLASKKRRSLNFRYESRTKREIKKGVCLLRKQIELDRRNLSPIIYDAGIGFLNCLHLVNIPERHKSGYLEFLSNFSIFIRWLRFRKNIGISSVHESDYVKRWNKILDGAFGGIGTRTLSESYSDKPTKAIKRSFRMPIDFIDWTPGCSKPQDS